MRDKLHAKPNIYEIPIEYKYREGKVKRTLKRELKGTEIAEQEVKCIICSKCTTCNTIVSFYTSECGYCFLKLSWNMFNTR